MTSYLRQNGHNPCQLYSSFIYLVAVKTVLQGFSMPFLGGLASKMGPRLNITPVSHINIIILIESALIFQNFHPDGVWPVQLRLHDDLLQYYLALCSCDIHTLIAWDSLLLCVCQCNQSSAGENSGKIG